MGLEVRGRAVVSKVGIAFFDTAQACSGRERAQGLVTQNGQQLSLHALPSKGIL